MKRNTPLDYAEFLLTHSRTRCELQICANGVKEKLASGYLKPFVAHLRAAEEQVAKGNQVIRLDRPSNLLKKNKVTWLTKGTLERFVRFVSTPEVLERVKNIDDELSQLEHVRVSLSRTVPQNDIVFHTKDTENSGAYQRKGSIFMTDKRLSVGAGDTGADASKIELLRAMDVRLIALKQEQSEAFSRAIAAGFDSSNMADLLDFAEHFGAVRLREACVQYVDLFRKRNIAQEVAGNVEFPSADAASSDSDMSLESCMDFEPMAETGQQFLMDVKEDRLKSLKNSYPDISGQLKLEANDERDNLGNIPSSRIRSRWGPPERLQINRLDPEVQDGAISRKKGEAKHQLGNYSHQEDIRQSNDGMLGFQANGELQARVQAIPAASVQRSQGIAQGGDGIRGGIFFSRLQKMAQQVEARRSIQDLGVHFTSVERSSDLSGSQFFEDKYSSSLYDSSMSTSSDSPLSFVSDGVVLELQRLENRKAQGHASSGSNFSTSEEPMKVKSGSSNSVIDSAVGIISADDSDKDMLEKSGHLTSESTKGEDKHEEPETTSARRLSVQAAISLFESKKMTVGEPPMRKFGRQDSQKGVVRSGSSSTEKSVLLRWGAVGIDGSGIKQDSAFGTAETGAEKAESTKDAAQNAVEFVEDSPRINSPSQSATEKSSSRASQSATQAAPVDAVSLKQSLVGVSSLPLEISLKQMPPAHQESFLGVSSLAIEIPQTQSKQELEKNLTRSSSSNLRVSIDLPSKPGTDTFKPEEVTSRRRTVVPDPGNKDIRRTPVRKELVDVPKDLGFQKSETITDQKLDVIPGSLGIIETALQRLPNSMGDNSGAQSVEKPKAGSLKHKSSITRPDENNGPVKTTDEPDKKPSLILHETPVDLYMQALVMMIDNNNQSSLHIGDELSSKDQRGRFYEHYRRLRNARQRGENPAKRAEREAKLKSMQEILERRKAEMEAGVRRQTKTSRLSQERYWQGTVGARMRPIDAFTRGELGEDDVVAQQNRLAFASSHAQIMPKIKVQTSRKAAPKLQKSCSISEGRRFLKNQTRVGSSVSNQCTLETSSCDGPVDTAVYTNLAVDSRTDASKLLSICNEASVKSREEMNEYHQLMDNAVPTWIESDTAATLVDSVSSIKNVDFTCQTLDTRQGQASVPERSTLHGKAQSESLKGNVQSNQYRCVNNKSLSMAQNVVQQHHNYFSSLRTGMLKHEGFDHGYKLSWEGNTCLPLSALDKGAEIVSSGQEDAGGFDMRMSVDSSKTNQSGKPSEKSRAIADEVEPSNQESLKSSDGSSDRYVYEDKAKESSRNDQTPLGFSECEQRNGPNAVEKPVELPVSDLKCSPSSLQEFTASTYCDAAASPINLFRENSGTLLSSNSPQLSVSPYSASSSPVSWKSSKTKHLSGLSSVPQATKDPARGFKKFLRFGRKSRNLEFNLTDGISVSTASEGDDEMEEVQEPAMRQSSNDSIQRTKGQEKARHSNSSKNDYVFHDQGATYSLKATIPTPSSNFKALDDRFLGGTSLKGSRLFFSLSSFRSKGGEGKLRRG